MTTTYITRAEIWLVLTILIYFLMNGAQIFETVVIIPKWTASPPDSFEIFKGKYGLDFKPFWIAMHSIHEITFILAIIFCWKFASIRNWMLVLFTIHFAVRVWTLVYFAPNIIEFQNIANTNYSGEDLLERTKLWKNLNYIRVSMFVAISLGMLPLCIKLFSLK